MKFVDEADIRIDGWLSSLGPFEIVYAAPVRLAPAGRRTSATEDAIFHISKERRGPRQPDRPPTAFAATGIVALAVAAELSRADVVAQAVCSLDFAGVLGAGFTRFAQLGVRQKRQDWGWRRLLRLRGGFGVAWVPRARL